MCILCPPQSLANVHGGGTAVHSRPVVGEGVYPRECGGTGMDMPDGGALDVATTALQATLGGKGLDEMAASDPRMLDLVLGLLFQFDP